MILLAFVMLTAHPGQKTCTAKVYGGALVRAARDVCGFRPVYDIAAGKRAASDLLPGFAFRPCALARRRSDVPLHPARHGVRGAAVSGVVVCAAARAGSSGC